MPSVNVLLRSSLPRSSPLRRAVSAAHILVAVASGLAAEQAMAADERPWSVSAYVEPYYSWADNRPLDNERPPFIFNYDRVNEVSVNLAMLRGAYDDGRVRGAVALAAGTYMDANYAAESDTFQNVFEANAGVRLSGTRDLWLDVGVLPSHIGFETAIGRDNWTLTRSLAAENTPYYEAGARVSYRTGDGKWLVSGLLLNGWQRIRRPDGNTTPAFGWQVTWTPTSAVTINSSSFVGNDFPDAERRMRYFHGFYGTFQLNAQWGLTVGLDTGAQQEAKGSGAMDRWVNPQAVVRYAFNDRVRVAGRVEYYDDRNGVIISPTGTGIRAWGASTNLDVALRDNVLWRIEVRGLASGDDAFEERSGGFTDRDAAITTALAVGFQ